MSKIIPDPKAPRDSTDYIYGERMEPYEERMNFFLDEKVKADKKDVEEKDKATVDGLEALMQHFTEYRGVTVPGFDEATVDGNEARTDKLVNTLIQLVKDAVTWLLNFINNRLARLDNRHHRISLDRKANGIKSEEVKYPVGVRRLLLPLKVSEDPNWVSECLSDVNTFYKSTVGAYKFLTKKLNSLSGDLGKDVKDIIQGVASELNAKLDVASNSYRTPIIPGNRRLVIDDVDETQLDQIRVYFTDTTVAAKLKAQTYLPDAFVLDKTLGKISDIIKEVRSNQSTVSQLVRSFEKDANKIVSNGNNLSAEKRKVVNWMIRFNKRLMDMSIQYTINSCDSGLDFVAAGIRQ